MSSNRDESDVKSWFAAHRLPWSDAVASKLDEQGVEFVEDLKLLEPPAVAELFEDAKPVVKARARIAWKKLGGPDTYDFGPPSSSSPPPPAKKARRSTPRAPADPAGSPSGENGVKVEGEGPDRPHPAFGKRTGNPAQGTGVYRRVEFPAHDGERRAELRKTILWRGCGRKRQQGNCCAVGCGSVPTFVCGACTHPTDETATQYWFCHPLQQGRDCFRKHCEEVHGVPGDWRSRDAMEL